MIAQHRAERNGDPLVERDRGFEGRRLLERDANIEPDRDQQRADQERDAPGPVDERRLAKSDQKHEEQHVAMKKPIGGPSWGNMPNQARRP